jgi:hypothetical protein
MNLVLELSKLILFFEKWMNPHTIIIHKVMPFKRTIFCCQQIALHLWNRHDGNWWCGFESNVRSARNAPYQCQTLCYSLRPASLCVCVCPKKQTSFLSVTSVAFELARCSKVQRVWYLCSLRCGGRGNHAIVSF